MISLRLALLTISLCVAPSFFAQELAKPTQTGTNGTHLADFTGKWVRKVDGRNFSVLVLEIRGEKVSGTFSLPTAWNQGGSDMEVTDARIKKLAVVSATMINNQLQFVTQDGDDSKDQDHHLMILMSASRASVLFHGWIDMAWTFERMNYLTDTSVSTDWPDKEPRVVSPAITVLQRRLKEMVVVDQAADVPPYSNFGKVCEEHYPEVLAIYEK